MSSDDFTDDSEGIKNLRKQYETQAETIKALNAELETFRASQREGAVKSALKAKGLNEKIAAFYQGEASEDAVSKWVDEYADVFGVQAPPAQDENAARAAAVNAASFGGNGFEPAMGAQGQVFGDPAKIAEAIKTLPYEELVKQGYMPDPQFDMFNRPVQ
jgi:hypothetical protein